VLPVLVDKARDNQALPLCPTPLKVPERLDSSIHPLRTKSVK